MDRIYKEEGKIIDGINVFMTEEELEENNRKFSKTYNKIAPFYDLSAKLFFWLKFGGEFNFRNETLKYIKVNDNDLALETSVGTGADLYYMNKNAKYYGVDISQGMLKRALKNIKKWNINAELILCEAEKLPFNDNVFDVTFSIGGFNYYSDKAKAINEMIRVSKPRKKIFIVDETEKTVKNIYKSVPGKNLYNIDKAVMPIDLIPKEMKNVEGKIINKGYLYIVSFEKP
ncbi:MAG: methyltransferase domain-containing protein [Treponema sp.]|jgi:ubiquinone/menaquinone biosynthesis C-methylase UbiE|nr:methyltransferase domain-containing protein [Treponema sp.]